MTIRLKSDKLPALIVFLAGTFFSASFAKTWQECGGYVIMEAEDTESALGKWVKLISNPGYTGSGHLEFTGNTINGGFPDSPLEYNFKINDAGRYAIKLRARKRLEGQPQDKCNDAYVRVEGDYTAGAGNCALSALTSDSKLYGGPASGWGYAGNLDVHACDHTQAWYNFKAGETYKLVMSGRSIRYQVDRIVFHTDAGQNLGLNTNTAQTLTCGPAPDPTCDDGIKNQGETGVDCGGPCAACAGPGETVTLKALTDFPDITGGEVPFYKDNNRSALAINAANESYRGKFAAATAAFSGTDGTYDITITSLTETDGECSYRLSVAGALIGSFQNPPTETDYAQATHTWTGIEVKSGDEIKVETNTHTNGKIPEGNGTAWARGRWTGLELKQVREVRAGQRAWRPATLRVFQGAGRVRFLYRGEAEAGRLSVLSLSGKTLWSSWGASGHWQWDGTTSQGVRAAPGLYLAVLSMRSVEVTVRFVVY